MKNPRMALKLGIGIAAAVAVAFPISFFATYMLGPLWISIEEAYGIEAVGHALPAEWCFWLVYGVVGGGAAIFAALAVRGMSRAPA